MRYIIPYFHCFTRSFSSFDIRIMFCGCCSVTMSNSLSVQLLCGQRSSVLHCLPECVQIHFHWVCDGTWPSHPLPPSFPFAFNLSQHQCLFQWVGSGHQVTLHIRWPKYCSFSFGISPSSEYSRLISFRIDWFDLLAVQGTLKSLNHNSKSTTICCSAFFMVQLSHPYMTAGKTIALTIQTFVGKVMSLLFNTLSRFVLLSFHRASIF